MIKFSVLLNERFQAIDAPLQLIHQNTTPKKANHRGCRGGHYDKKLKGDIFKHIAIIMCLLPKLGN